jgi:hypothetical protein
MGVRNFFASTGAFFLVIEITPFALIIDPPVELLESLVVLLIGAWTADDLTA